MIHPTNRVLPRLNRCWRRRMEVHRQTPHRAQIGAAREVNLMAKPEVSVTSRSGTAAVGTGKGAVHRNQLGTPLEPPYAGCTEWVLTVLGNGVKHAASGHRLRYSSTEEG